MRIELENDRGPKPREERRMSEIQADILAKGKQIFELVEEDSQSLFSMKSWYGRIMDWSMKNEHFKTQMFRFVDVLPYLNSGGEVARHLKEYFAESGEDLPSVFNFGLGLGSLAPGLMAGAIRKNVTQMAKMFITGETPAEALDVLKKSRKNKIGFTVDLLGEACLSEAEAVDYQTKYLDLIDWLARDSAKWTPEPQIDSDHLGDIPKVNVSVKLSALYSQIDLCAYEKSKTEVKERLRPVFRSAMSKGVFLNLDMEQYELKAFTVDIFKELINEPEFASYPHWGCVIQAYLRDSLADVRDLIEVAKRRGVPFTIRLVKGAYWDFETVHALQSGWPVPVYTNKRESDANYEACALLLLQNVNFIKLALGSHNVRSIAAAIAHAEKLGVSPKAFEIQMLYGMADPIKRSLVRLGYRVREYAPVGELIPGMAYLVRRLLENTSNESFLRSKFAENASSEELLKDPADGLQPSSDSPWDLPRPKPTSAPILPEFRNEPILDFGLEANRQRMFDALTRVERSLGSEYPLHINGKDIKTGRFIESVNPSNPGQIVGRVHAATPTEALSAVAAAKAAFETWKLTSAEDRAALIDRLADLMVRDRSELSAIEVFEVGKTWEEAEGDIAEAIDFCRYYARDMRRIARPQRVGSVQGEVSLYHYQPRGVSLVIAPWNFPLAILTGMVAASIVTGNTVVFKPAEQSAVIGAALMRLLREAGVPAGVANLVQGYGEEIGDTLTGHKDVHMISFTGSKAVGLHILKQAAIVQPGQTTLKRVICEMGGKNAIIIDSDADLDEAVIGTVYSAFGFAGQKCSAASRVIVVGDIYERFVTRLVETTRSIRILPSRDPDAFLGPVVDKEAFDRIRQTIENGKSQARLAFQGTAPAEGYFIPPTIFVDVPPDCDLAQKEIFGPVLSVIRAKDIDDALKIANSTEYALTGGLYSRSPAHIEKIKRGFEVGNLYINRGITGALVDRHPFGGFKMSGLGSKTGGPDYLLQFMEPRVMTENTLRRGFAPADA